MKYKEGQKTALVLGSGGFIGSALVKKLKKDGFWVRGVDLKHPEFSRSKADEHILGDLRDKNTCSRWMFAPNQRTMEDKENSFDEIYQLAAEMGGAGYIFTKEHDADVMHNSCQINLNIADLAVKFGVKKLFYSSSACVYPEYNQLDANEPDCAEHTAYPAAPDSNYGWEKLFSERLYIAYARNYGLNVRIVRFHNIFGTESTYDGGREKSPAALCRKVAQAKDDGEIEIWGDGKQTRSFLYIDECLKGVEKLMSSDCTEPLNIGSDEMISINDLAKMIIKISGKKITIKNVPSNALGVRGRNSDNRLIKEKLGWSPDYPLKKGIAKLYEWVNKQVNLPEKHKV